MDGYSPKQVASGVGPTIITEDLTNITRNIRKDNTFKAKIVQLENVQIALLQSDRYKKAGKKRLIIK